MFSEVDGQSFPKTQTNTVISEVCLARRKEDSTDEFSISTTSVFRLRISIKGVLKDLSLQPFEGTTYPKSVLGYCKTQVSTRAEFLKFKEC